MPVRFVDRYITGYMPILEASEGYFLSGRKINDGVVCETFFEALAYLNHSIEQNRQVFRKIRVAKVMSSRGWGIELGKL